MILQPTLTAAEARRAPRSRRSPRSRRGAALMYVTVTLAMLMGLTSLAVDVGHVHLVRSELRQAADAAARYAAQALIQTDTNTARVSAADCARENNADGTSVTLNPQKDIDFGTWDPSSRTFTVVNNPNAAVDAVRVTARRTSARGNPVRLFFASVVGMSTYDLTVSAVARVNPRKPGIVGLDWISMTGSAGGAGNVTNSYLSKDGVFTTGSSTYGHGTILSNGNITIGGSTEIYGDARPGVGKAVILAGGSSVSGNTAPLTKPVSYPMLTAGPYATTNDNAALGSYLTWSTRNFSIGSVNATFPGGTYYVNDFYVGASASVTFSGPATLYVTGNVTLTGNVYTSGSVPSNLRIVLVTSGTSFSIGSSSTVYADVYAPGSAFTMGGSSTLCGSVIARSVTLGGSARVIFDESMTAISPAVSLVQ